MRLRLSSIPLVARIVLVTLIGMLLLNAITLLTARKGMTQSRILAFTSNPRETADIFVTDLDRAIVQRLTDDPADDLGPVWSSQSQRLAFYSDRDGDGNAELYQMALGSRMQQVATDAAANEEGANLWQPGWSADGEQIVFIRDYRNIRIMDADGTNERGLALGFAPTWSPAEPLIAFYDADRQGVLNTDIYVIGADGKNLRNVTQNSAHDWDPAWSPDGRELAFVSSRNGNAEIYVTEIACAPSCPVRRLTFNSLTDKSPAWSPDGRFIVYESESLTESQILVVRADGSSPYPLEVGILYSHSPAWINFLDSG